MQNTGCAKVGLNWDLTYKAWAFENKSWLNHIALQKWQYSDEFFYFMKGF